MFWGELLHTRSCTIEMICCFIHKDKFNVNRFEFRWSLLCMIVADAVRKPQSNSDGKSCSRSALYCTLPILCESSGAGFLECTHLHIRALRFYFVSWVSLGRTWCRLLMCSPAPGDNSRLIKCELPNAPSALCVFVVSRWTGFGYTGKATALHVSELCGKNGTVNPNVLALCKTLKNVFTARFSEHIMDISI